MLDGPDGNKIDCMFFPCTSKEEVIVDESVTLDGRILPNHTGMLSSQEGETSTVNNTKAYQNKRISMSHTISQDRISSDMMEPMYVTKPTVIMCNPNALYY